MNAQQLSSEKNHARFYYESLIRNMHKNLMLKTDVAPLDTQQAICYPIL